ncbi:MAG: hypothetical protein Nk1A_6990 [Endomicrobiia bacterium]|nr:MAG: hypothetical protein Nk1A_6990 [Endomicrobiia bacterium]
MKEKRQHIKKLLSIVLIIVLISNIFETKLEAIPKFWIKTSYVISFVTAVVMVGGFTYNNLREKKETRYLSKYLTEKIFLVLVIGNRYRGLRIDF